MGQLCTAQVPGQQQPEEPGVGHVRSEVSRHLALGVDPVSGFVDPIHKGPGRVQIVGDIVGYRGDGHLCSQWAVPADSCLRYTGANMVSKGAGQSIYIIGTPTHYVPAYGYMIRNY